MIEINNPISVLFWKLFAKISKIPIVYEKSSKQLIIIRGLPGSGKSTLAKSLVGNGIIHSTDNYFVENGIYIHKKEKLSEYHELNLEAAINSMEEGISPIVIDNTNIFAIHALSYVIEAKYHGYKIVVAETQTPWRFDIEELVKRNVHDCPREVLENMIKVYESDAVFKKKLRLR